MESGETADVEAYSEALRKGQEKVALLKPFFPKEIQKRIIADPEVFRMTNAIELLAFLKGWTEAKMDKHNDHDLFALNGKFKELENLLFGQESEK